MFFSRYIRYISIPHTRTGASIMRISTTAPATAHELEDQLARLHAETAGLEADTDGLRKRIAHLEAVQDAAAPDPGIAAVKRARRTPVIVR